MVRADGRSLNQLRTISIKKNFIKHAEGSVLIQAGNTKVICNASVEEKVPPFLRDKNQGWVTAEYSMLPRSTHTRTPRESSRGKVSGRTQEIQRLIGRSLRSVVDMEKLGERTLWIDCDVIQADGGTRTTSITGAFVAMCLAMKQLKKDKLIETIPVKDFVAATSVGILQGKKILDLDYSEDSVAEVDMNIVKTGSGGFVEVQGTAERDPFSDKDLAALLSLAHKGIKELVALQKKAIGSLT
ncbi:MAG: ribonuclease PH [Nitrospinaceae bacterium]|nr:ribonuclease PH [Nitrospinaceae bacterium]NIR55420.1 ribonuclease PH [Nitrospinaceae bacterium]NIS85860.1 ribonuclease PH [Nitrospinaceae bacterium]NIT82704.1 ribonuclease PH [Nitrospinaceae bacterium]NIU44913.1 ribonuclease PH [Nitrospinaceae bacterium]